MRKINCIAIDDEPIALFIIKQFCDRKGGMEITTFCDPRIGLEEIIRTKPDLVFLDIEMNGLNGLDVAKALPVECTLIFTTAHAKYALDGFNLDAVDFLHKPIAYKRFERAVEKAMLHIGGLTEPWNEAMQENIVVKQDYTSITVPISDIFYIDYSRIFRIPKNDFLRVHRSFLIPISKVCRFSKQEIHLQGLGRTIPIGRSYAKDIYEILAQKRRK